MTWPTKLLVVVLALSWCGIAGWPSAAASDQTDDGVLAVHWGDPICGPIAIWQVARHSFDSSASLTDVVSMTHADVGLSIDDLITLAGRLGLHGRALRVRKNDLRGFERRAILYLEAMDEDQTLGHFVVYAGHSEEGVWVVDGPVRRSITDAQLASQWPGIAVFIAATPGDLPTPSPALSQWLLYAGLLLCAVSGFGWLRHRDQGRRAPEPSREGTPPG